MAQLKILAIAALIISAYSFGAWTTSNSYEKKISKQAAIEAQEKEAASKAARGKELEKQQAANELAIKLAETNKANQDKTKQLQRLLDEYKRQNETCGSASNSDATAITAEWVRIYNDSLY